MIDETNLEENSIKMMGLYNSAKPLAQLIEQLEWGRELMQAGGKTIADTMMVSKGIIPLAQTGILNKDIR